VRREEDGAKGGEHEQATTQPGKVKKTKGLRDENFKTSANGVVTRCRVRAGKTGIGMGDKKHRQTWKKTKGVQKIYQQIGDVGTARGLGESATNLQTDGKGTRGGLGREGREETALWSLWFSRGKVQALEGWGRAVRTESLWSLGQKRAGNVDTRPPRSVRQTLSRSLRPACRYRGGGSSGFEAGG